MRLSAETEQFARTVTSIGEKRPVPCHEEASRAANKHADNNSTEEAKNTKGTDSLDYVLSLDNEDVDIVLRRNELKAIIDVAVANTMILIDDCIISVLQLCVDGNQLSPIGTAVSIAVRTIIGVQVSPVTVCEADKNATVQMRTETQVIWTTAAGLTKCDEIVSSIAMFVATTVKKKTGKVEYIRKEQTRIEPRPSSSPL